MRILLVCAELTDGGAQRQFALLANALRLRDGCEVTVLIYRSGLQDHLLDPEVDVVNLQCKSNFDPRLPWRVAKIARSRNIDFLMSWLVAADLSAPLVRLLVRRMRWAMTERDSHYPATLPRQWRLRLRVGQRADLVLANSEQGAHLWRGLRPSLNVAIVNNIIAQADAGSPTPVATVDGPIDVVFVGRLEPQKAPLRVAQVFVAAAQRMQAASFALIGQGSLREDIAELLSVPGVPKSIQLMGYRKDARGIIGSARALVSLSLHEGQPNVVLEAISAGVPVVVSDIPEHRSLLGPDYPFYVDENSSAGTVADVVAGIWHNGFGQHHYEKARGILGSMTAQSVAAGYVTAMAEHRNT